MTKMGTLEITMPTDREIKFVREFNAPREMVFDAFRKPELLKKWFGPHGYTLPVCEVDWRVGGGFRFVLQNPSGKQMGMRGVYRELVAPERSVHEETFDDFPGSTSIVTAVFTEKDGRTTMTAVVLYPSKEIRDIVAQSGMQKGATETYERLEELLAA